MNPQVKEKLNEENEAKNVIANEQASKAIVEEETLVLEPQLFSEKAVLQYREATEFKYIDAFLNYDETKKLVDEMRKELGTIDDSVQSSIESWMKEGAKKHKRPQGMEAEKAMTLMGRVPAQTAEVRRFKKLADYYSKLIHRLDDEFMSIARPSAKVDAGTIAAMPTTGGTMKQ